MKREFQQRTPLSAIPGAAPKPSSFSGLAAAIEADLERDLERIQSASWDLSLTKQRLEGAAVPSPAAPTTAPASQMTGRPFLAAVAQGRITGSPMHGTTLGTGLRGPDGAGWERETPGGASDEALKAPRLYTMGGGDFPTVFGAPTGDIPPRAGHGSPPEDPVDLPSYRNSGNENQRRRAERMGADMAYPVSHEEAPSAVTASAEPDRRASQARSVDKLQSELKQAREELHSLRTKTGTSEPTNGPFEAQRRKLDQRAMELRERVMRAQQALDERARKLRQSLDEERERLKAYHAQLQKKARQISEYIKNKQAMPAGDVARQREAIEAQQAEMDHRRAKLDSLETELREQARQELARKRAELEQGVQSRLAELRGDAEARQRMLEEKECILAEREASLEQIVQKRMVDPHHQMSQWQLQLEERERALSLREKQFQHTITHRAEQVKLDAASFEAQLLAREQAVADKEANLQKAFNARLAAVEREQIERQGEYDTKLRNLLEHESQLNRAHEARGFELQKLWDAKEAEFQARWQSLSEQDEQIRYRDAARHAEFEARQRALADREASFQGLVDARLGEVQRDAAGKQSDWEAKEKKLREREAKIEGAVNTRLAEMKRASESVSLELEAREAALARRERAFVEREDDLKRRLDVAETARGATEAELRAKTREMAERAKRYSENAASEAVLAAQKAELDLQAVDLHRRTEDLESRERRLREWQTRLEGIEPNLEATRLDVQRRQSSAEQLERENQQYREKLASHEESLKRQHEEMAAFRQTLDARQGELEAQKQRLQERLAQSASEQQVLSQARADLERDRARLVVESQTAHSRAVEEAEKRQEEISREKAELADAQALARDELESRRAALEADSAMLERDRIAMRDRERTIAEQRTQLESAQREMEQLRRDLASRTEETEELRRVMAHKSERMRERKARLAEDAALVDTRLKQLNGELDAARQERLKLADEQKRLEEKLWGFSQERQALAQQRDTSAAEAKNLEAAQTVFEEEQRKLADREARLTERANQLESFGVRLKEEYADLQKQRMELANIEAHDEGRQKLDALLKQADEHETQLRQREQALTMQERALSAVAAEVSAAEDEVKRRMTSLDSRSRQASDEVRKFERERHEFQALADGQRAELAQMRRQAELEIAREQDKFREREGELEIAFARQREAIETAGEAGEETALAEMRRRVEAGLADRIAGVQRNEQQVQRLCERRISEVERDIEQRLAQLGEEIKAQRLRAAQELDRRREEFDAEIRQARAELPRQVAAHSSTRAISASAVERQSPPAEQDYVPDRSADGTAHEAAGVQEPAPDDRVWLDESAEYSEEAVQEYAPSDLVFVSEDESPRPSVTTVTTPAAPPIDAKRGSRVKRIARFAAVFLISLIVGGAAGVAYLWTSAREVEVSGRLKLASIDPASMTARDLAAVLNPEVLGEASRRVGADLNKLYREKRICVTKSSSGSEVELTARVPQTDRAAAQTWLESIAKVHGQSLGSAEVTTEDVGPRIAKLEAEKQGKVEALHESRQTVERLQAELAAPPPQEDGQAARQRKESLKAELAIALAAVNRAKSALSNLEAEPEPTGPVVPSELQLSEAYESDVELAQAIEYQNGKAAELHTALQDAMKKTDEPFGALLASVEEWIAEARKQLDEQTDKDIKHDLELLVVDMTDYLQQARSFEQKWGELKPIVDSWQPGGDVDALAEYQKEAEGSIRDFHAKSRDTFGEAAKKADEIGRSGSEMTQRRVIQSAMTRLARASLAARNAWTVAARNVVPRYNTRLKGLMSAVADVSPRISERKSYHRGRLAEELAKSHVADRQAALQKLRADLEAAHRRHQQVSDEYLNVDAGASANEQTGATMQRRKDELAELQPRMTDLEAAIVSLDGEIERVRAASATGKAVFAGYQTLPPAFSPVFDVQRVRQAVLLGAVVAAIFVICVAILSRRRRKPERTAPAP